MDSINTVEIAVAVVTDTNVKKSDQSAGAAESKQEGGKNLPSAARSEDIQDSAKTTETTRTQSIAIEKAVMHLNEYVQSTQRDLRFSVDEELGRTVVRVVDSNSQEVIRQIPNETALRLARNLNEIKQESELERLRAPLQGADASLGLINTRI